MSDGIFTKARIAHILQSREVAHMGKTSGSPAQILSLHLFYIRILKEHALFYQVGFRTKNSAYAAEASGIARRFDELLFTTIRLAKGIVPRTVLLSGELITRNTEEAERRTQFFAGVPIDMRLTAEEAALDGDAPQSELPDQTIGRLNRAALAQARTLIRFGERVRGDVLCCQLFTGHCTLLDEHMTQEAMHYVALLQQLMMQDGETEQIATEQGFWNRAMQQHALFIKAQLDPAEQSLQDAAEATARRFEVLVDPSGFGESARLTAKSIEAVSRFRLFTARLIDGILRCEIRSVLLPLAADHMLREANHYLRLLREG